jgi:hypothetical protein
MGETLRRITGKAAIHQLSDPIREQLEPLQWGVGSSRGCVTIIHTLRDYLSLRPQTFHTAWLYSIQWLQPRETTPKRLTLWRMS